MNRNGIDFTKKCQCAVCGTEKGLSEFTLKTLKSAEPNIITYTSSKILLCKQCEQLTEAKDGFVKSFSGIGGKIASGLLDVEKNINEFIKSSISSNSYSTRFLSGKSVTSVHLSQVIDVPYIWHWINAKENAFAKKVQLAHDAIILDKIRGEGVYYKRNFDKDSICLNVLCPVCGEKLKCLNDLDKTEISDDLVFGCENSCFSYSESDALKLFGNHYSEYLKSFYRRLRDSYYRHGDSQDRAPDSINRYSLLMLRGDLAKLSSPYFYKRMEICKKEMDEFRAKLNSKRHWVVGSKMTIFDLLDSEESSITDADGNCSNFVKLTADGHYCYCSRTKDRCEYNECGVDCTLCKHFSPCKKQ